MALPLNVFRTVTASATPTPAIVYTAPTGYTGIVLLAQVCNTDVAARTVSFYHRRGSDNTAVVFQYEVPEKETLIMSGSGTTGRLVLETGDSLVLEGSANGLKFIASILETLK